MAFVPLDDDEISAGEPVKQELFSTVKANEADHETRITDLEAVAFSGVLPISFEVNGNYGVAGAVNGIAHFRVSSNITLIGAKLLIHTAGSSGTTDVDVKYKRAAAAFTSIFSTRPSLTSASGDYAVSTNAVISTTDIDAADILRLDIITTQSSSADGFSVYLEFEPR